MTELVLQPAAGSDPKKPALSAADEARAAAASGNWDAARAAMARAIEAEPNHAGNHAYMAWYTSQCSSIPIGERQRLAEHHLAVSFELDPNCAEGHYVQGRMWQGDGNTTRARMELDTAVKMRPNYPSAVAALVGLKEAPKEPTSSSSGKLVGQGKGKSQGMGKLRLPLAVGAVLVAIVGALAFFLSADGGENNEIAHQLGITMKLNSASRQQSDLYIEVQGAWEKLDDTDKSNEMQQIAQHAEALGIKNVFVYDNAQIVAEVHGAAFCLGEACHPQPAKGAKK
jgi:tetratricopeptide (TPR) repeat protein